MTNVLAIHDISTMGKASLTVVIPILSAMGLRVCPLPTMVLSTITGGKTPPITLDLTDFMKKTAATLDEEFDWIYSGFLGNAKQAEVIAQLAKKGKNVLIDPVLGDNGKLYSTMGQDMVAAMKNLLKHADIITPNWTEAQLLTDGKYATARETAEALGVGRVVITSVPNGRGQGVDIAIFDHGNFEIIEGNYEGEYNGAGDSFASVLLGKLSVEADFSEATRTAARFVRLAVSASTNGRFLCIEKVLDKLDTL